MTPRGPEVPRESAEQQSSLVGSAFRGLWKVAKWGSILALTLYGAKGIAGALGYGEQANQLWAASGMQTLEKGSRESLEQASQINYSQHARTYFDATRSFIGRNLQEAGRWVAPAGAAPTETPAA